MRPNIFLYFVFLANIAFAQQEPFQGMVVDSATFSALPYVTVRVKGTSQGTITDANGNFNVQANRKDTLLISMIGYDSLLIPLLDWETSVIRLAESITFLNTVIIQDKALDPYSGLFEEQNAIRDRRKNKFYYSKEKREKNKVSWLLQDNLLAKTYVDLIVNNPETKAILMETYKLTEEEYYQRLERFNEKNYRVMYYLTAGELLTLLNNFFLRNQTK